jgi:hypothetical protein
MSEKDKTPTTPPDEPKKEGAPSAEPPAKKRGFDALFGQWPGDETDEEIQKALEEIS